MTGTEAVETRRVTDADLPAPDVPIVVTVFNAAPVGGGALPAGCGSRRRDRRGTGEVSYRWLLHAHAIGSLGRINSSLLYELSNVSGPPLWWLDERKLARGPTYGLVRLNPPPDCADRGSYLADALTDQLETMLAQGWTVNDPADLDKLDPADLDKLGLGHLVAEQ